MRKDSEAISTEAFDRILLEILQGMKASSLLDIPGVYELVADEFNNEVIERWERERRAEDA